jgi:hypothetical protein
MREGGAGFLTQSSDKCEQNGLILFGDLYPHSTVAAGEPEEPFDQKQTEQRGCDPSHYQPERRFLAFGFGGRLVLEFGDRLVFSG